MSKHVKNVDSQYQKKVEEATLMVYQLALKKGKENDYPDRIELKSSEVEEALGVIPFEDASHHILNKTGGGIRFEKKDNETFEVFGVTSFGKELQLILQAIGSYLFHLFHYISMRVYYFLTQ